MKLDLTRTPGRTVSFYVFPPGGEMGLNNNFWISDVRFNRIEAGDNYDVFLTKERNSFLGAGGDGGGSCDEAGTEQGYLDCIRGWAFREYSQMNCSEGEGQV